VAEEAVDRAVVATHESTVDRPHNTKGVRDPVRPSQIARPRTRASGVVADSPECGDARRRVRRRGPRSRCRASFRAYVGCTRS
jgi:hypothetical protein